MLGEIGDTRRYGIYYTPEVSNAIFAMAEGAQATAGASVIGNLTGRPNIFFNDPFAGAQPRRALCPSRSATIRI